MGSAVICFLLALQSILTAKAEVYSCGGFVKSPNAVIDYSRIQIKLFTAEGNLKFETDCSPTNGYYMIPVYNKGDYSIRLFAPDGWFFEPNIFDLKVDGKTDVCTKGEDINFILEAFAVQGVLRSGSSGGPAGIALILASEDGTIIAETKTVANGAYQFKALPGKYSVSTANDSTECIELGKVSVSVIASPVRVSPDLKISGHLLSVAVLSKAFPLSGVSIKLYSEAALKLPYCQEEKAGIYKTQNKFSEKFVCEMMTDFDGIARFPCLPPGSYLVYPSLYTDKVHFSFSPESREITMRSEAEKIAFDTLGFRNKGQVLLLGRPVADADIYVNGELKAKTNERGWYEIDGLYDDHYVITAKKNHFTFNTVNIKLVAQEAEIPDIVVERVEVCVKVDVEESSERVMTVSFTNQQTKSVESLSTASDGKLCTLLPVGLYIVSVRPTAGVIMTPKQSEVDLSRGSVMDIVFSQFKADVTVNVVCIADDCGQLKVELWRQNILIKSLEGVDHFVFHEVAPDSYKLIIVDNDRFCWENTKIDIFIERADLSNLIFRQTGYRTSTRLSHPAKAKWNMLDKPQVSGSLSIPAGNFFFCIPLTGIYTIILDACHKFDKKSYEITIPQETPLFASATEFLVSASVLLDNLSEQDDFVLIVKSSRDEQIISVSTATSIENELTFIFYLSILDIDALITLVPQSKSFLFKPTSHVFHFSGECHLKEVVFKADKGIFLEGQVLPAVENVEIHSSHKSDPNVKFKTVTDKNGSFRIGPIRNVKDFNITAEKNGYKFEETEKLGVFNAIKLSQLIVVATDVETETPLTTVLISLSGTGNYRSNNFIDDTGKISFVGLQPGEYFLRPILQEYKFEPKSMTIIIKEGELETVNLKGRRFAYSVFGRVSYPANQPAPAVVVEAVSDQCNQLQEEDTTDDNGEYRIRGLHPTCVYRLVLKTTNGQRMQSYPVHYDITVNAEDVKDINFVLTHVAERVEIAGEIAFLDIESPARYKVGLYKGRNLLQQVTVVPPSNLFYFDIPQADNLIYSVRLDTSKDPNNQRLVSDETFFTVNDTFQSIILNVHQQVSNLIFTFLYYYAFVTLLSLNLQRKSEVEISVGSYFAFPFFFIIAYLFFNHQKVCLIFEVLYKIRSFNLSIFKKNIKRTLFSFIFQAFSFIKSTFVRLSYLSLPHRSPSPSEDFADQSKKRQRLKKA
ncbi:unnamed protein product [Thelazia callipaeda]|uniref:Nodal modulator 1 n=1 Tax=Thelazia callipaeda TaxID=103827 RepID=A0A158RCY3_THECL|nr:unnamed protein product [Thelazia callipaeda]